MDSHEDSTSEHGTPSTSRQNRKLFKRKDIDSDSDNEPCPKMSKNSKFSSSLATKKIYNSIISSTKPQSTKVNFNDDYSEDNTEDVSESDEESENLKKSITLELKTARNEIEDLKAKVQKKEKEIINLKLDYDKLNEGFAENIKDREKKVEECQKNKEKILELEKDLMKSKAEVNKYTSALILTYKEWIKCNEITKRNVCDLQIQLGYDAEQKKISSKDISNNPEKQNTSSEDSFEKSLQDNFFRECQLLTKSDEKSCKDVQTTNKDENIDDKRPKESAMEISTEKFEITKEIVRKCKQDSISNLTNDLLEKVFTLKELGTSSVKGKQSNANIKKGYEAKPALNPIKLKAVKDYVLKKFGRTLDNKKLVNAVTRYTLNEAERRLKESSDDCD